ARGFRGSPRSRGWAMSPAITRRSCWARSRSCSWRCGGDPRPRERAVARGAPGGAARRAPGGAAAPVARPLPAAHRDPRRRAHGDGVIHIWIRRTLDWHDEAQVAARVYPAFRPKMEAWNATFTMPYHRFRYRLKAIA